MPRFPRRWLACRSVQTHLDGVHAGQPVRGVLHQVVQPQGVEALPQLVVHAHVPVPHALQALLRQDLQLLLHTLIHQLLCQDRDMDLSRGVTL